ncbi:MAG: ATP-dependent helicase [Lysobacterales bacterium]|nr:putative ATP-dependent helicase DinG [Xanthomonadales bacterium]
MSAADALGPESPFAADPNFTPRGQQQRMATAIEAALDERGALIVEAGTGTGKTFAYLVPVLLQNRRVIVSTGTKTLQDQLFHRDLPRVCATLKLNPKKALLKGRANYLCLHRLELAEEQARLASREAVRDLAQIRAWARLTRAGDRMELDAVPEDSSVWPWVTSTADNCLGSECPKFNDCFVVKARRKAQESDVVVVNHHLLFADLAIKREGFGEILPGAQAFILDEAHQIAEVASQFFTTSLSFRQLVELCRDTLTEAGAQAGALALLKAPVGEVEQRSREFRLALDNLPIKGPWWAAAGQPGVEDARATLEAALTALASAIESQAERSTGLAACSARAAEAVTRMQRACGGAREGEVCWYELFQRGYALHATPLDAAEPLAEYREASRAAWVATSATLAVGSSFALFQATTGFGDAATLQLDSPFDYPNQALLYQPLRLPEPNQRGYTEAVVDATLPVLAASKGRAFLLFTSHRALREAAEILRARTRYPLFVQGERPRPALLADFIASGNGVLLGAASFWEGVDVPGEALSVVVIDKLPFAQLGDPVMEARLEAIRQSGGNPFRDYQLPSAVLALKQGAGRLIRSSRDRGVLMLCDPRINTKAYGRQFLDSLPPMRRTRAVADVEDFFGPQSS